MINVQNKGYIKASRVTVGDRLRFYSDIDQKFVDFKIERIDFKIKNGYVAPLTREGTLLVNRIDSSCFAEVNNHQAANMAMTPLRLIYKLEKLIFNTEIDQTQNKEIGFYSMFLYKIATNLFSSYLL